MQTNEIKTGSDYLVKVGRNEVKVKVLCKNPDGGWSVGAYSSGKNFPVKSAERFIKCLENQEQSEKKMSMLDAATEILKDALRPMSAKELITAMEEKGLWKTQTGKTPSNTLSAAIGREIREKENPRFKKVEKGKFALH